MSLPHKLAVMEHLDSVDETARRIGAVNTVTRVADELVGTNTDWIGAALALERETRSGRIQLSNQLFHAVIGHRGRIGIEGIGLDDVSTGTEELIVDVTNDVRSRDRQQIIVTLEVSL